MLEDIIVKILNFILLYYENYKFSQIISKG